MSATSTPTPCIAIVGAGPLGLATALALTRRGQRVRIFDAHAANAAPQDHRILALSQGSRDLLELLDAWPARLATPISTIHVSQATGFVQTRLSAREQHVAALGYVVAAQAVLDTLRRQAQTQGIAIEYGALVEPGTEAGHFTVSTADGKRHEQAELVIYCEGGVQEAAADLQHDYAQHALLCLASPATPHANHAHERFTPRGPLALLPYGNEYAVVWSVPASEVERLLAADDAVWLAEMNACLPAAERLSGLHERAHYPLGLRMRSQITGPRCVWLGNAAQTLHPVAGQGFNLALRDAWTLAETLTAADDPGAEALLRRYARARRLDRTSTARFTDLLAWGFASSLPGLTPLRDLGLLALETLPPLRQFLARRMIFGARAWP
jgi:2-octaprenyl-6-methoxyphenol hydroxylase